MNSKNTKTSKSHVSILKFTNKLDLKIAEKILVFITRRKT